MRVSIDITPHARQKIFLQRVRAVLNNEYGSMGPYILALLGGWGCGKSVSAAVAFAMWVMSLRQGRNGHRPQAAVFAPTFRVVEKVIMPKLMEALPREVIVKKVGRPHPTWSLINGVDISFVSGEAIFEGEDLTAIWVDEVHKMSSDPSRFQNYLARLRDKRNPDNKLGLMCTGLPEAGWCRQQFDVERMDLPPELAKLRHTVMMGTADNPHLPDALIQQFLASCPSGYEEAYIRGGWMPAEGALYVMFSDDNIVDNSRYDKEAPVSVGIDAGVTAAAVVGQEENLPTGRGALIIDNFVKKGYSVEAMCELVRDKYVTQLIPGKSVICVDPTFRADEMIAVRRVFPSLRVIKRGRTDPFYAVEPGQRLVQAAMKNAKGQRSLHIIKRCDKVKDGLIEAYYNTKVSPITGNRVKDNRFDHVEDAARYLVNHLLGDNGFAPQITR